MVCPLNLMIVQFKTSMEVIKSLKARAKRNEIDTGKIHGHLSCSKKEY